MGDPAAGYLRFSRIVIQPLDTTPPSRRPDISSLLA
jgi:hypothetical protein